MGNKIDKWMLCNFQTSYLERQMLYQKMSIIYVFESLKF